MSFLTSNGKLMVSRDITIGQTRRQWKLDCVSVQPFLRLSQVAKLLKRREIREFFAVESNILDSGIRNTAQGIRNLTNDL